MNFDDELGLGKSNRKEKKEPNLNKIQNCMWSNLNMTPFAFECQLRNFNTNKQPEAISFCKNCQLFKDTNQEIDGGYLG